MRNTELVQWFRQSTPYVNMHREKTFVIMLDGNAIAHPNLLILPTISVCSTV
ncbi:N-acetylglutamate synthase [Actinobacillus equuli]|nr:N-acetylglutamate synthase [Actinobacillus equuli]